MPTCFCLFCTSNVNDQTFKDHNKKKKTAQEKKYKFFKKDQNL